MGADGGSEGLTAKYAKNANGAGFRGVGPDCSRGSGISRFADFSVFQVKEIVACRT
jgi:hypothetical protein